MNLSPLLLSLAVLLSSLAAIAGIGGSSGGSTADIGKPKYERVEVCDSDGLCRQVTYRVRNQDSNSGAGYDPATEIPCETSQSETSSSGFNCVYKVPGWLKKLNAVFGEVVEGQTYDSGDLYNR